ncbi:enoyl-CoA hydratase/isomerase family protein [Candidatus Entotheonella palauensis]|nr:enoyl-CoA hydratase/isomerase family protein [Candidatus Entotheonella palauensis]
MFCSTLHYARQGPVAIITLNRPDKLNAINPAMLHDLGLALDQAEADDAVRAVVVHGAGRAFSAGFDIEGGTAEGDITEKRRVLKADFDLIMRFWDCPKPTVAAVHGYCLGGALELALACDMTVAAEDTRLGEPEPKFGSGVVALLLPWMTGPKLAKELLLSGNDRFTAHRAYEMGLVNQVTAEGEHVSAALALANNAALLDRLAVTLTKQAIHRSYEIMGMRQALLQALETDVVIECTETAESREFNEVLARAGLKAALARRELQWGQI